MIRRHPFNLIEITLALLVISIGVMAIMGLIPIGARAHSSAVHKNQAADAAEQVLNGVARSCVNNWGATVGTFDSDPLVWDWKEDGLLVWKRDDTLVSAAPAALNLTSDAYWGTTTPTDGVYVFEKTPGQLYRMVRTHETLRNGKTLRVNEVDAVFAVWADRVTGPYRAASGFEPSKRLPTSVRLNVEVSWPGGLDYAKREKMYFSMEVQQP